MSGGGARHSACKYCRDHKVRCDGGQPSCTKCHRLGEECIYLPTQRPTRADLTQTVAALQKRLQARISGMTSQSNGLSRIAATSNPPYNTDRSTNAETQPPAAFLCPLPAPSRDDYQPPSPQPYNPALPSSSNDAFLRSLHTNETEYMMSVERMEPTQLNKDKQLGGHIGPDFTNSGTFGFPPIFQAENPNNQVQGQNYVDIAELLTPDISEITEASSSCLPAPVSFAPRETLPSDNNLSEGVAAQLANFSTAVFRTQAEIAGMSSAVAAYIAWMRKVPAGMTPPNTTLVYPNLLETIEERVREMGEIAEAKPRAAFREMMEGIQKLGPAGAPFYDTLGGLQEKLDKQSADMAKLFSMRYNACALMSEQASGLSQESASRSESHESSRYSGSE
ncbi:hypothetical protein N7528_003848 [Penicillium herquei]|nr:hypothetical protein N7528_003848 [Penicillium herquei]